MRGFISYCRHDAEWLDPERQSLEVDVFRSVERRLGLILWRDRDISAGQEFEKEILCRIDEAEIAVLLISDRFLTSQFVVERELPRILDRRTRGELEVIPILVRRTTDLGAIAPLQIVPSATKPLIALKDDLNQWDETMDLLRSQIHLAFKRRNERRVCGVSNAAKPAGGLAKEEVAHSHSEMPAHCDPSQRRTEPLPSVPSASGPGRRNSIVELPELVSLPSGEYMAGIDRLRQQHLAIVSGVPVARIQQEEVRRIHIESIQIAKYPVTRAQFAQFLEQADYSRWAEFEWAELCDAPQLPMTEVSWHDAQAYCDFYGFRLPRSHEWEYAASGPNGYNYPWGNQFDEGACNDIRRRCGLVKVGALARNVSQFGVCDLIGNVWQLADGGCGASADGGRDAVLRIARGGSHLTDCSVNGNFYVGKLLLSSATRKGDVGFRVCSRQETVTSASPTFLAIDGGGCKYGCGRREEGILARFCPPPVVAAIARQWSSTRVRVPSFELTRDPVSNLQYYEFVRSTGYSRRPANWWNRGRPTGFGNTEVLPFPRWMRDLPVTQVTFVDACAFAEWVGGRLPSSEEWEYAARGAADSIYPWGNDFDCYRCNTSEMELGRASESHEFTSGEAPTGLRDLCGNVSEMVGGPVSNGVELRGGGWNASCEVYGLNCYRILAASDYCDSWIGFRVARS